MNQDDINTFLAIVRNGSFTRAASVLFSYQTTISHRIKILEAELGYPLFERRPGTHTVVLTSQGRQFLPIAEQWSVLWDNSKAIRDPLKYRSQLYIGGNDRLNSYFLPPFYMQFSLSNKNIYLNIRSYHSGEIIEKIERRELDAGFISIDPAIRTLETFRFMESPLVMICRASGFYADSSIHPEELDPANEVRINFNMRTERWHTSWWNDSIQPYADVDTYNLVIHYLDEPQRWALCPLFVANALAARNKIEIHSFSVEVPHQVSYLLCRPKNEGDPGSGTSLQLFLRSFKTYSQSLSEQKEDRSASE